MTLVYAYMFKYMHLGMDPNRINANLRRLGRPERCPE